MFSESIGVSALINQLRPEFDDADETLLQYLRGKELIGKPTPLGRGRGSVYDPEQAEHIYKVLIIRKNLGQSWRIEELAFWMAAHRLQGVVVSAHLVAAHIKNSIELFHRYGMRLLDRSAKGRLGTKLSPEEAMAKRVCDSMFRDADDRQRTARPLVEKIVCLFCAVYYLGDPISEHRRLVRDIAYELYEPPDADAASFGLYAFLERNIGVFSPELRTNSLILAVDRALRVREHHRYISLAPSDAVRGYLLMSDALTDVPVADIRLAKTNAYLFSRVARVFIPALAGLSIDTQIESPRSRLLMELRSGHDFGLRSIVNSIIAGQWFQSQKDRVS